MPPKPVHDSRGQRQVDHSHKKQARKQSVGTQMGASMQSLSMGASEGSTHNNWGPEASQVPPSDLRGPALFQPESPFKDLRGFPLLDAMAASRPPPTPFKPVDFAQLLRDDAKKSQEAASKKSQEAANMKSQEAADKKRAEQENLLAELNAKNVAAHKARQEAAAEHERQKAEDKTTKQLRKLANLNARNAAVHKAELEAAAERERQETVRKAKEREAAQEKARKKEAKKEAGKSTREFIDLSSSSSSSSPASSLKEDSPRPAVQPQRGLSYASYQRSQQTNASQQERPFRSYTTESGPSTNTSEVLGTQHSRSSTLRSASSASNPPARRGTPPTPQRASSGSPSSSSSSSSSAAPATGSKRKASKPADTQPKKKGASDGQKGK